MLGQTFKHINTLSLRAPSYFFSSKLDKYASIKARNLKQIKRRSNKTPAITNNPSFQTNKDFISTTFGKLKCEGCSANLQSKSIERYGYIDENVLGEYIKHNTNSIKHQLQGSDVNHQAIREVQEELGITILQPGSESLDDITDVDVLLKLEEKIQGLNKERQSLITKEYKRKELYCRRCYYLKHYNQLPDEHNNAHNIITETSVEQLLTKIFSKKDPIHYFYLIDIFDICGTLTKPVLERLFQSEKQFSLLLTKADVVNKKYLNYVGIKPIVRDTLMQYLKELKEENKVPFKYNISLYLDEIYMVGSVNAEGVNKIKKKVEGLNVNVQLLGYPNAGKTTLLNFLTSMKKPTSTVPGTSLTFEIGKFNNIKIFDCPGFYNPNSMYNLIQIPNERRKMAWKEPKFAPGILTNSVVFFGGMVQIEGVRVVVFGHGGAKALKPEEVNEWLLSNYETFWHGLPPLHLMRLKKYEYHLDFLDGKTDDLEIAGYGFLGFKLCRTGKITKEKESKKLTLFLPESIGFRFRKSLILDNDIHNPATIKTRFQIPQFPSSPSPHSSPPYQ